MSLDEELVSLVAFQRTLEAAARVMSAVDAALDTLVGNKVVVTVLEARADQVRSGIDAPREIQVHRGEVYRQLVTQNAAAVAGAQRVDALRSRLASWRTGSPRRPGRPQGTQGTTD